MDVNTTIIAFIYFIGIALLLIFNEINYRRLNIKGEISRKFAHFVSTLATVIFPYIFSSHWYVLVLAIIFFIVLFITKNGTQLKSIHDIDRKSIGSYLLPLSIYITFFISEQLDNKLLYILPMLILAISDPMAAIVGISLKKNNHKIIIFGIDTKKSIFGSGAFFLSSLIISLIALYFNRISFDTTTLLIAFLVALVSSIGELLSWRGSDNISIPISVILVLTIFI
ncbi:MAG: phosphatidate cytidylyltransferase [Bacteroidetes bacterium]|nr:MAG: phosphatidate cytidylyltransferase [Bacteroidota bacterium]